MSDAPYPGLRPFRPDETDIFFGREPHVDQLLEKLQTTRFLAVVGPSGSGKSSLVRAGMLPALELGYLTSAGAQWRYAELRPGNRPLRRLAEALLLAQENLIDAERTAFLEANLRRGPLGLVEILAKRPLPARTNLLILVDQFEEIFRYRAIGDPNEAEAFINLLLTTVREAKQAAAWQLPVYIVLTMRSDFLGDCAVFLDLPEAINNSQFLTPRLTREQRREAITEPAAVFDGKVEEALVNRLLNDMGSEPDQLPVMQHILLRMWASKPAPTHGEAKSLLTLADYEQAGGWNWALSQHADEAYTVLNAEQQVLAEILFRALTERSSDNRDTRRPVNLAAVATIAGVGPAELIPVIETFRDTHRNFITPANGELTPDTILDISHESLIRQWRRLHDWVIKEAEAADFYKHLERTARAWNAGQAALWGMPDLDIALAWQQREQPTTQWAARYGSDYELAFTFLAASEQQRRTNEAEAQRLKQARERQRRLVIGGLSTGLVFALLLLLLAGWLWRHAENERQNAEQERQRAQTASQRVQVLRLIAETDTLRAQHPSQITLSALLTTEAMRLAGSSQFVEAALRRDLAMLAKPMHYFRHHGGLTTVSLSRDGRYMASGSNDGNARLWELATGRELGRFAHGAKVNAVLLSHDSRFLFTASDDHKARCWEIASGSLRHAFLHDDVVTALALSGDGRYLATGSNDRRVKVWDIASGQERLQVQHDGRITTVLFAYSGNYLATAGTDHQAILWDLGSGRAIQRFRHAGTVNQIAISQNGRYLATASTDNSGAVWDLDSGRLCNRLIHEDSVNAIQFSPNNRYVATASADDSARLWEIGSGREKTHLRHEDTINALSFSDDGSHFATASGDGTARIWETESGREVKRLPHEDDVIAVHFSADGQHVLTASRDASARWWALDTNREQRYFMHEARVNQVDLSDDGRYLASASRDGTARIWAIADSKQLSAFRHDGEVYSIAISDNGLTAVTASADNTARIWETRSGREIGRLQHGDSVYAAAISHDGERIATASADGTARLWETKSKREIAKIPHKDVVNTVVFSKDGRWLATASRDKTAVLWDLKRDREVSRLIHGDKVNTINFSNDGNYLISASRDRTARLWEVANGRELRQFRHENAVSAALFSPDGRHLATASEDRTARLWDVATGKELQRLSHDSVVHGLTFSPRGQHLATASGDHTVRVWQTLSGREMGRFPHGGEVHTLVYSPDGDYLATASDDGIARLLNVRDNQEEAELLEDYAARNGIFGGQADGNRTEKTSTWFDQRLLTTVCAHLTRNLTQAEWQRYFEDEPYRETCGNLAKAQIHLANDDSL